MTQPAAADEFARRFGPGPHWVIADQHDIFVGVVRLARVDTATRSARLGIGILDPGRLGQGLGTEAIRLSLAYGFEHLGLHRVSLTVLADNTRAIAAYARCGFSVEGLFGHTLFRDGAWHDDLSMAILKPQWEAREAGAEIPVTSEGARVLEHNSIASTIARSRCLRSAPVNASTSAGSITRGSVRGALINGTQRTARWPPRPEAIPFGTGLDAHVTR